MEVHGGAVYIGEAQEVNRIRKVEPLVERVLDCNVKTVGKNIVVLAFQVTCFYFKPATANIFCALQLKITLKP